MMMIIRRGHLSLSFFFFLFRATHVAHGGSQARGRIRAVAAATAAVTETCLQATPQLSSAHGNTSSLTI